MDGRSAMVNAVVCIWLSASAAVATAENNELAGPNVCATVKNSTEKSATNDEEQKRQRTPYFCLYNVHLTCYTENNYAVPLSNKNMSTEIEKICCEGYEPSNNGTWCLPVCKMPCVRGTCVAPNVCKCHEHYEGPYCNVNTDCPSGKFGYGCMHTCPCKNEAFCDSIEGFCVCQSGFTGEFCEFSCPPEFYGYNCVDECKCQNGATCNPKNGSCTCKPGYTGKLCEYPCPADSYGYNCQYKCKCQNGALCDLENGICSCQPGYVGRYCELPCSLGYYGYNCTQKCKCRNSAMCDPVTGECSCPLGYIGKYCEYLCPSGFFGHQCQYECRCRLGATCDPVNGNCHCEPGWTGYNCTTVCPIGSFGVDCNSTCKCDNEATCRPTDGVCLCKPGFYGPTCSEACPINFYGDVCLHKCVCDSRTEICDPIRGCICDTNRPNNKCFSVLHLESENEFSITWLFEISVVFSFIIITIIFAAVMTCYLCCYRHQIKNYRRDFTNNFELYKCTSAETVNYTEIGASNAAQTPSTRDVSDRIFYVGKKTSYTNEIFYAEYSRSNCSSEEAKEHIYLEIDENTFRKRPEDLYDHLDFLRPTGSWKPHYQKTMVLHDQGCCSSNAEENTV